MRIKHRRGSTYRSSMLAAAIMVGVAGGCIAEDPFYLYAVQLGNGVLNGAVSLTINTISNVLFPDADNALVDGTDTSANG